MKLMTLKKAASVWFGCFVALSLHSATAHAQLLFDNGAPDLGANGAGVYFADTSDGLYPAGNVFTPVANGTVASVNFAGVYYNMGTPTTTVPSDLFAVYLYSVMPGTAGGPDAPGALIAQATLSDVTSSVISTSSDGFPIYQFSGNLSNLTGSFALNTSTEFYFGISDTTNPYEEFAVDTTASPGPTSNGWQLNGGSTNGDLSFPTSLAFSLSSSSVPEPSSWGLLPGGLGTLLLLGRFRLGRRLSSPGTP